VRESLTLMMRRWLVGSGGRGRRRAAYGSVSRV